MSYLRLFATCGTEDALVWAEATDTLVQTIERLRSQVASMHGEDLHLSERFRGALFWMPAEWDGNRFQMCEYAVDHRPFFMSYLEVDRHGNFLFRGQSERDDRFIRVVTTSDVCSLVTLKEMMGA